MAAVLKGKVDAILLTGGIAYGKPITDYITPVSYTHLDVYKRQVVEPVVP